MEGQLCYGLQACLCSRLGSAANLGSSLAAGCWLQAYKSYRLGGSISELLYSPALYGIDLSTADAPRPQARSSAMCCTVGNDLWLFGGIVEVGRVQQLSNFHALLNVYSASHVCSSTCATQHCPQKPLCKPTQRMYIALCQAVHWLTCRLSFVT